MDHGLLSFLSLAIIEHDTLGLREVDFIRAIVNFAEAKSRKFYTLLWSHSA